MTAFSLPLDTSYVWGSAGKTKSETAAWLSSIIRALHFLLDSAQQITIVSDAISPSRSLVIVDTEGGAASDRLSRIHTTNLIGSVASSPPGFTIPASTAETRLLILRIADASRHVTIGHGAGGAGQILTYTAGDVTLRHPSSIAILAYDAATSAWRLLSVIWGNGAIDHGLEIRADAETIVAQGAPAACVLRRDATTTGGMAVIEARQRDSASNWRTFSAVEVDSTNVAPTTYSGRWRLRTARNGALTTELTVGGGLAVGTASPQGVGSIAASSYYVGSTQVTPQRLQVFTGPLPPSGGFTDFNHSLGARPDIVHPFLICETAQGGYSPGDAIPFDAALDYQGGDTRQLFVTASATTLRVVRFRPTMLVTKTADGVFAVTDSSWSMRIIAGILL